MRFRTLKKSEIFQWFTETFYFLHIICVKNFTHGTEAELKKYIF